VKIFKILAGVILILSGVFCFANPGATFPSVAFLLGWAMLIAGIAGIVSFFWIGRKKETMNLILVDGILNVILGCFVLANLLITDAIIPVFFGMWVMFSGVLRVVDSYAMKKARKKIWYGSLILGVVGILVGMYAFLNPVLADLSVVMQVGIFFLMQGINVLGVGFHLPHIRKHKFSRTKEIKQKILVKEAE